MRALAVALVVAYVVACGIVGGLLSAPAPVVFAISFFGGLAVGWAAARMWWSVP